MELTKAEIDALNITENWYGGYTNIIDYWIASIPMSIIRDLINLKLIRKRFLSYEITNKGLRELSKRNINHYTDTRYP